jgi:hypothetical protein
MRLRADRIVGASQATCVQCTMQAFIGSVQARRGCLKADYFDDEPPEDEPEDELPGAIW